MLFVLQGAASLAVPEMYPQTQTASSTQRFLLLVVYFVYPWLHSDSASEGRRTKLHPSLCPQCPLNKPQLEKLSPNPGKLSSYIDSSATILG